MHNNPDAIQRARRYMKRYKIWYITVIVCLFLGYLSVLWWDNALIILLATLLYVPAIQIGCRIVFNQCIPSILTKKLDADALLAMVCQWKLGVPVQLMAEFYCGHYQNVVSICKMKLADPKTTKRDSYIYFDYLATVYFDVGDDENLRKVCEQYEATLAREKPSKQAKYRKLLPYMRFCDLYLKQDVDACISWINDTPIKGKLSHYNRIFCRARLAVMQGNTEEACGYYEILANEVPQLNYGKLAACKLAELKGQAPEDGFQMFEISDEITEVTLYTPDPRTLKRQKITRICSGVLCLILGILTIGGIIEDLLLENEYKRETEAYEESVRVLLEYGYNDVVVLDTFTLSNGEEIIDTMFICKTDTEIVVGSLYTYSDQTEMYFEEKIAVPITSLTEEHSIPWNSFFPSTTSLNRIYSGFYKVKSDIPAEYYHLSTFKISGQKIYYVVTDIEPIYLMSTPDL